MTSLLSNANDHSRVAQDTPGFGVEVLIIPPFPYLHMCADMLLSGTIVKLGAQVRGAQGGGAVKWF